MRLPVTHRLPHPGQTCVQIMDAFATARDVLPGEARAPERQVHSAGTGGGSAGMTEIRAGRGAGQGMAS